MAKAAFLGAALALLASAVHAADAPAPNPVPCFRYEQVARQLKGAYAEAPVSLGLQSNGNLLQVFSSQDSGTWTIISTTPQGLTCILAAGNNWQTAKSARRDPTA